MSIKSLRPISDVSVITDADSPFLISIEHHHNQLQQISLSSAVPSSARQLFETAKNLSLYSWFVYHFHQVSELISFSADGTYASAMGSEESMQQFIEEVSIAFDNAANMEW